MAFDSPERTWKNSSNRRELRRLTQRHMPARRIRNTWYVDIRHEGIRYRRRSPENSRPGAQAYEAVLRSRLARDQRIDLVMHRENTISFQDFSKRWFNVCIIPNRKHSSMETYQSILKVHLLPAFGRHKLSEITSLRFEQLKAEKRRAGLSPKRINNIITVLNGCLQTAVEWGELRERPTCKQLKVQAPPIKSLTDQEVERLLEQRSHDGWSLLLLLALRTGMRIGELLALRWEDMNFTAGTIAVSRSFTNGKIAETKNYQTRYIPMTREVVRRLQRQIGNRGFVFCEDSSPERPWPYNRALRQLRSRCRRSGVRVVGWHILRHTFASQLVTKGVPIYSVMKLLGHSSIKMTERYAHLGAAELHAAVAALESSETAVGLPGQPVGNSVPYGAFLERHEMETPKITREIMNVP